MPTRHVVHDLFQAVNESAEGVPVPKHVGVVACDDKVFRVIVAACAAGQNPRQRLNEFCVVCFVCFGRLWRVVERNDTQQVPRGRPPYFGRKAIAAVVHFFLGGGGGVFIVARA